MKDTSHFLFVEMLSNLKKEYYSHNASTDKDGGSR